MTTRSLHALLANAAFRSPGKVAVDWGDETTTYGAFFEDSCRIASLLAELGVRTGDRVALFCDRGLPALGAVFGALIAGAAYVPVDVGGALARNARMISDADPSVILTTIANADRSVALAEGCGARVVVLDGCETPPGAFGAAEWREQPAVPPDSGIGEHDLAYILYTSGSTGVPKGVALTHGNALSFVEWAARAVGLAADDRVAGVAPLHFDLSTFDLFATVHAGGTMVPIPLDALLLPRRLPRAIAAARVSVWYSVPSVWMRVLEYGRPAAQDFASLRAVLFAGEVFPVKHLASLMRLVPHARFLNLYGPTETNVCTWFEVDEVPDASVGTLPIGKPIHGVECAVVDDRGAALPPGEEGELWVAGPTVMRGYWRDDVSTARALAPGLPESNTGAPAYRTGDRARVLPSGDLEFLGRRDDQVKANGYRIELGEVEAALAASPGVVEAAAVGIDGTLGTAIHAFLVLQTGTTREAVSETLHDLLPRYMFPEVMHIIDTLPRTSTGKVDRTALRNTGA